MSVEEPDWAEYGSLGKMKVCRDECLLTPVCRMDILAKVRGEHGGCAFMLHDHTFGPLDAWFQVSAFLSIFMAESSRSQVKNWFLRVAPPEHAYLINTSLYLCSSCERVYCFRLSYWTPRP